MVEDWDLDPYTVLGVQRGCSAEEIRDAYHKKSRKHHPDHGGDDWAFRVVVRAYEVLGHRVERERLISQTRHVPDTGRIRAGITDKGVEPLRLVQVEIVWMRYEAGDLLSLLAEKGQKRNLSGTMNVAWPPPEMADRAETLPNAEKILEALNAAFDELRYRTRPTGAVSSIEKGCFQSSLGYLNGQSAWEAFKLFRVGLQARGLGVKQWTRDVLIPRDSGA